LEDFMRTLFTTAIALFIPLQAFAGDMQTMSIDQMKAAIVGNSLSGMTDHGEDYIEHYLPDGRIVGISKAAGRYEGQWSFRQDGLMCFRYGEDALAGGCVRLSRSGDQIGIARVDGSVEPTATLIEGMAPQLK
jgi:hypothetical protein